MPSALAPIEDPIEQKGTLASFPWHIQQKFALASATNVVVILGGNRSGKTTAAAGIVSRLVRREGPIYRRLRKPEGRALRVWVSPQLFEKFKSNWEDRLLNEVFDGIEHTYTQSPQPVFRWKDSSGGGEVVCTGTTLADLQDLRGRLLLYHLPRCALSRTGAASCCCRGEGVFLL